MTAVNILSWRGRLERGIRKFLRTASAGTQPASNWRTRDLWTMEKELYAHGLTSRETRRNNLVFYRPRLYIVTGVLEGLWLYDYNNFYFIAKATS